MFVLATGLRLLSKLYEIRVFFILTVLYRMKAILFTLIQSFEFNLAMAAEEIGRRNNVVGRPFVLSDPASGHQLPLLIRACQ
jgi:hypothetical protein